MRSWPCFYSSWPRLPSLLRRESTAVFTFRRHLDGMIDSRCSHGYVDYNLRSLDKELRADNVRRLVSQSLLHCVSQVSFTALGSIMPRSFPRPMSPLR
jgi:hypothetical protein